MPDRDRAPDLGLGEDVDEVRADAARGVVLELGRLVGAAVPEEVGRDDAVAGAEEERDLVAPVVCGRREAVHEEQRELGRVPRRHDKGVVGVSGAGADVFVRAGVHSVSSVRLHCTGAEGGRGESGASRGGGR